MVVVVVEKSRGCCRVETMLLSKYCTSRQSIERYQRLNSKERIRGRSLLLEKKPKLVSHCRPVTSCSSSVCLLWILHHSTYSLLKCCLSCQSASLHIFAMSPSVYPGDCQPFTTRRQSITPRKGPKATIQCRGMNSSHIVTGAISVMDVGTSPTIL